MRKSFIEQENDLFSEEDDDKKNNYHDNDEENLNRYYKRFYLFWHDKY